MSLRVYNTLSREKEPFTTIEPGKVGMYLCGPTVYKPSHIGHMVGPVIFDAIKRFLQSDLYANSKASPTPVFKVKWVVNITDVDDKLIEAAAKQSTTVEALASKYTAEYFGCLERFGIKSNIDVFPKASEHMEEIKSICLRLIERGFAYASGGNVWFDVAKDPSYGQLSNRRVEEQESGLRNLEGEGKRSAADFALWKAAKPGEPAWDSPWGSGRPGWHIECSAMSLKHLGETFDIHGGGMDLLFPHHENELAQSHCASGKPFVKYWLHNGLTRIRTKLSSGQWADEKMSGSLGNVVSARELIDRHGADVLRYLLLSTHYRSPIEFNDEALENAAKGYSAFTRLAQRLDEVMKKPNSLADWKLADFDRQPITDRISPREATFKMRDAFVSAMEDDFNTAGAIAAMHQAVPEINRFLDKLASTSDHSDDAKSAWLAAGVVQWVGRSVGLFQAGMGVAGAAVSDGSSKLSEGLMELVIALRAEARATKNFALGDRIRDGLSKLGVVLEDRSGKTTWRVEPRSATSVEPGKPVDKAPGGR